jgi:tetratricopeptide (TPR) repeat protein
MIETQKNARVMLLIGAALAALVAFLVYLPSLNNGFVNWDDPYYVYRNANIRSFDLVWAFTAEVSSNWHPLTLLSHTLDYALFGLDPRGHHLTNNILHTLNTFLVAILFYRLIKAGLKNTSGDNTYFALSASIIGALFFALHPLRVESVAWISERKDLLYAFFYILSVLSYLAYAVRVKFNAPGKGVFFVISLVSFILSLLAKPMAVSLPLVLIIIDSYPLGRATFKEMIGEKKNILIEKIPFILLAIFSGVMTLLAQGSSGAMSTLESAPLITRLLVACRAYIFYIYKTILPIKLAPIYPYPESSSSIIGVGVLALIILIILSALCFCYLKNKKLFASLWLYYIVTLVPVIGIIQVGRQSAADRYTYLPGLALIMLASLFLARLISGANKNIKWAAIIITIILSVLMSVKTVSQAKIWKDSVTLWSYEIGLYNDYAPPVAFRNRGLALHVRREYKSALKDFDMVIKLDPTNLGAFGNRALTLQSMGRNIAALKDYDKAISIDPNDKTAINNRGTTLGSLGRIEEAKKSFERALEIDPDFTSAYNNLGKLYKMTGDLDRSIYYYKEAARRGDEWAINYLKKIGVK